MSIEKKLLLYEKSWQPLGRFRESYEMRSHWGENRWSLALWKLHKLINFSIPSGEQMQGRRQPFQSSETCPSLVKAWLNGLRSISMLPDSFETLAENTNDDESESLSNDSPKKSARLYIALDSSVLHRFMVVRRGRKC